MKFSAQQSKMRLMRLMRLPGGWAGWVALKFRRRLVAAQPSLWLRLRVTRCSSKD